MLKKVFFDLDGTLVDQKGAQNKAAREFFLRYDFSRKTDEETFVREWEAITVRQYDLYLSGQCTYFEQRERRIEELFGHFCADRGEKSSMEIYNEYLSLFEKNWRAFPDAGDCLKRIKKQGLRLGVITNGNGQQQKKKLESCGLDGYFEDLTAGDDLGLTKRDRALFEEAYRNSEMNPGEAVYIGDDYCYDAVPCLDIGTPCIIVNRNNAPVKSGPLAVVRSLSEVPGIIRSIVG